MKSGFLKLFFTLLLTYLLVGCATLLTRSTQTINVQVLNASNQHIIPDVRCVIEDNKGRLYYTDTNPGSVEVTKGQGGLTINCNKSGFIQKQVGLGANFNAWTLVNVIFWPGLIVDSSTGAIQKYPNHVTVLMEAAT